MLRVHKANTDWAGIYIWLVNDPMMLGSSALYSACLTAINSYTLELLSLHLIMLMLSSHTPVADCLTAVRVLLEW